MCYISNIIEGCIAYYNVLYQACYSVEIWYCNIRIRCHVDIKMSLWHYRLYVDIYIHINLMALIWHSTNLFFLSGYRGFALLRAWAK